MPRHTVISGGLVVTESDQVPADLVIEDGRIAALLSDASGVQADQRIEADGLLILPGGIDAHTHFREPDDATHEGFTSGGRAAAAGGITTVVEMPQAGPTTTTAEQLAAKKARVEAAAIVDMALWAGIAGAAGPPGNASVTREIDALVASGAVGFKSFMASSSPSFPAVNEAELLSAMIAIARLSLPYALHAEHDALLQAGIAAMRAAKRTDAAAHAESRPPLVEAAAVNAALFLSEQTGCWVHFCHVASAEALHLISEARGRDVRVTVETCPQYLALTTDDLCRLKGYGRCAPALRDQAEVDAIWSYVLDETVDFICSDHSAFTRDEKAAGEADIFAAPLGLPGVQTLLPVFYDEAVNKRGMSSSQFVRQIATNPAQIFGLYPRKGTIRIGGDADLVIFDPEATWTVRDEDMLYRQQWTPFAGRSVTGRVLATLRRGELIYDQTRHTEDLAAPGSGHLLTRDYGAD